MGDTHTSQWIISKGYDETLVESVNGSLLLLPSWLVEHTWSWLIDPTRGSLEGEMTCLDMIVEERPLFEDETIKREEYSRSLMFKFFQLKIGGKKKSEMLINMLCFQNK